MMGPKKLSTIRAEMREAFGMSDKELLAWFNRQIEELEQEPKVSKTGKETLLSLKNALLQKGKKRPPRREHRRAGNPSKS